MSDEPLVPARQPDTYQKTSLSVKQLTAHPTQKVSAMVYGGGGLAIVINWLRARFGFEFMPEDIELILLVGAFISAYFTKERDNRA